MLKTDLDIIYNKGYLVIVPKMSEDLLDAFQTTFGNTILMDNTIVDKINTLNFIKQNNFKKIIFVDYQVEYLEIIKSTKKYTKFDFIFTESMASFSDEFIYTVYKSVFQLYKKTKNSTLGIMDNALYECLKNQKEKVKRIILDVDATDIEGKEQNEQLVVGVLSSEHNPQHGFYNELTAIKLVENAIANLQNPSKTAKNFLKKFNIKSSVSESIEEVLDTSDVNLYVNFTRSNTTLFIKSMDKGIPCILGNVDILDEYPYLKNTLVMKSDDNVNEMAEKIENVFKNKKKIAKEYNTFRKDYSKKSKKSTEEFLGRTVDTSEKEKKYEVLLSVIVPVYNTEKYLKNSLDSIIDSIIDNTEILVINDGSVDNSEEIILKYVKKYPDLIRYIKQDNHGLGNVRNVGLKEARGKYIASIDSDDTINMNFFREAEKYLQENVDIVMCDWLTVTDTEQYETAAFDWIFNNNKWNRYEALLYTTIMPSACNKIVKKEIFEDLSINYIEDKFEDLSTTPFVMLKAQTIKYINKAYYEYYIRSNSIMRTTPGYSMIDVLKMVNERLNKYQEYLNTDKEDFKYYTYSWRIEEYILNQLYTIDEKEISNFIQYINKNLKDVILDIFNNKRYLEMLNSLDEKERQYIEERNKSYKNNKLEEFIKKARKKDDFFKITPPIIYYGNQ